MKPYKLKEEDEVYFKSYTVGSVSSFAYLHLTSFLLSAPIHLQSSFGQRITSDSIFLSVALSGKTS